MFFNYLIRLFLNIFLIRARWVLSIVSITFEMTFDPVCFTYSQIRSPISINLVKLNSKHTGFRGLVNGFWVCARIIQPWAQLKIVAVRSVFITLSSIWFSLRGSKTESRIGCWHEKWVLQIWTWVAKKLRGGEFLVFNWTAATVYRKNLPVSYTLEALNSDLELASRWILTEIGNYYRMFLRIKPSRLILFEARDPNPTQTTVGLKKIIRETGLANPRELDLKAGSRNAQFLSDCFQK